ncbi:MAG: MarR family transcriptional regulator [Candidatus Methanosuratincola sp.]|jgi:DNA-binding MarR family transcriptional regulator
MEEKIPKEVATTILLTVYRSGELTMTELHERTKFSTITVLNHVNALLAAGLLEEERTGNFPKKRVLRVSQEGKRAASLLNLADLSGHGSADLIEMGAKAGRVAAYQEGIASLRRAKATKEWLVAELFLKGIGGLAGGISAAAKGFPEALSAERDALKDWSKRLEAHHAEGQKRLAAEDLNGCIATVSKAVAEFAGASKVFSDAARKLKEMKLEELANYIEFLAPKQTQKE